MSAPNPGALPPEQLPSSARVMWAIRADGQVVPVKVADDGTLDGAADGALTTGSATSATTIITNTNTAGYGHVVYSFTSFGGGSQTVTIEGSNDGGTTWVQTGMLVLNPGQGLPLLALTRTLNSGDNLLAPVVGAQMRLRITSYGSGTVTAWSLLKRGPLPPLSITTQGTAASGSASVGNPSRVAGRVNTAVQAFTNGNAADLQQTVTGAVLTEEAGRLFNNISTTATTLVKSGAGFLHTLTINTPVASSVITIYDSLTASGTKIGTITLPAVLLQQGPYTATFDLAFATGLTILTATGASDLTVTYR